MSFAERNVHTFIGDIQAKAGGPIAFVSLVLKIYDSIKKPLHYIDVHKSSTLAVKQLFS